MVMAPKQQLEVWTKVSFKKPYYQTPVLKYTPKCFTILWNVYERTIAGEPRTNNHLEGWHRRFKSIVDKHHPNIYTFLDKLKGEQARTETVIEKLVGGEIPVEVRQKVRRTNGKIVRIVADFDSRPAMEYLRGLAYNIRY